MNTTEQQDRVLCEMEYAIGIFFSASKAIVFYAVFSVVVLVLVLALLSPIMVSVQHSYWFLLLYVFMLGGIGLVEEHV